MVIISNSWCKHVVHFLNSIVFKFKFSNLIHLRRLHLSVSDVSIRFTHTTTQHKAGRGLSNGERFERRDAPARPPCDTVPHHGFSCVAGAEL